MNRMTGLLARIRDLLVLVRMGRARRMWREVALRLYSSSESLGLRRDLAVPFTAPLAKQPVRVRPLVAGDDLSWLRVREPGLSDDQVYERLGQLRLLRTDIGTCHIAVGTDGQPCFMQWLIHPSDNGRMAAFFGNLFPSLAPDEVLLEGAYTPEPYRGQGIMASAMAQIAEHAETLGARWAVTFVDAAMTPSLKGCAKAGFVPYVRRHEKFRLFRRCVSFTRLTQAPRAVARGLVDA